MNERQRRLLVGIVLPVAGLAIMVLGAAVITVPDPMATHWGVNGDPDDSMSSSGFITMTVVFVVLGAIAALAASRRKAVWRGDLVAPVAIATFLQWVFVGVGVAALLANAGVDTWTAARQLPLPLALLVPAAAGLLAVGAGRVVAPVGEVRAVVAASASTVGMTEDERIVWLSHATAKWPLALGGIIALVGTLLLLGSSTLAGLVLLVTGAAVGLFAAIEVTVDRSGLSVGYGPFGWPRTVIALERIERAEAVDVRPMHHGGWGYRGSLRFFGRASVVIRAGEGIALDLVDGKRFVVTADQAETGAGTVNDLVAARVGADAGD